MICKKCKKEIAEDSIFCNWCGKKQTTTKRKTAKRVNGSGSVYKRSDLKNNPWVAVTPITQEIIGHFSSSEAANAALADYNKNPTTKLNITLKELHEEWRPLGLKGKSKQLGDSYNAAWNKLYAIYDMKFRDIRTAQMQQIIEDLQEDRPKLNKEHKPIIRDGNPVMLKPASYSSLHDVKVLMGLLYKYAMQNDIVNKNYAEFLILPKNESGVKDRFNDLDIKKIEQHIDTVPYADCVLFLCYCGYRIEEFLTLDKYRVKEYNGIYVLFGGNKSASGKCKKIPVHSKILPILKKWQEKDGKVIFCMPDGSKFTAKKFREECYYPALEMMGLRRLTPHACRRTFYSRGHECGISEQDLIALMGHTDIEVGTDFYLKQSVEALKASIEKIS